MYKKWILVECTWLNVLEMQLAICKKYEAEFLPVPMHKLVGIATQSFDGRTFPINGLRHQDESSHAVNWYIWAGEFCDSPDFFQPVHADHLITICPKAINYLGLGPGWRFLFDDKVEDVWYDQKLLEI